MSRYTKYDDDDLIFNECQNMKMRDYSNNLNIRFKKSINGI